ncbi:MAG: efflux RND transporter periplasmic adaptor subunit [Patescibacteria group bacterium]|jgi:HlyD family secretion protein
MKKRNKVILIIIAVLVVVAVVYFGFLKKAPMTEYVTAKVEKGNLVQTVSATGSVKSTETIDLNFAATGRIVFLPVKVGDKVAAGQALARLDSSDLSSQLRQAQASLASAQANLNKLVAGATVEDVNVTSQQVDSARVAYLAALVDLENAKKDKDKNLEALRATAVSDLNNYLFKAKAAMDTVYNTINDNDAKDTFSDKNSQLKIDLELQRVAANQAVADAEPYVLQASSLGTIVAAENALTKEFYALNQVNNALDLTFNALLNTPTSSTFTTTELDTLKTSVRSDQTIIATGITTIGTDKSNLQTKENYYNNQIDSAQSLADKAKTALDLAEAQLLFKKAPTRSEDIEYQHSVVKQAEAQVGSISSRITDRIITAPVDGIITAVNNAVGETAGASAGSVIVMLPNNPYYIEVDISEADIAKLKLGNKATYTLDSYGSDVKFSGQILAIDPAETVISGVVYYRVKVDLGQSDKEIKSGMTANIDIVAAEKNDVLYIPQRAVKNKDGKKVVEVMIDKTKNEVVEKVVEIGLKADDGLIEIVSGLNQAEEIVVYVKNASK